MRVVSLGDERALGAWQTHASVGSHWCGILGPVGMNIYSFYVFLVQCHNGSSVLFDFELVTKYRGHQFREVSSYTWLMIHCGLIRVEYHAPSRRLMLSLTSPALPDEATIKRLTEDVKNLTETPGHNIKLYKSTAGRIKRNLQSWIPFDVADLMTPGIAVAAVADPQQPPLLGEVEGKGQELVEKQPYPDTEEQDNAKLLGSAGVDGDMIFQLRKKKRSAILSIYWYAVVNKMENVGGYIVAHLSRQKEFRKKEWVAFGEWYVSASAARRAALIEHLASGNVNAPIGGDLLLVARQIWNTCGTFDVLIGAMDAVDEGVASEIEQIERYLRGGIGLRDLPSAPRAFIKARGGRGGVESLRDKLATVYTKWSALQ